MSLTVTLSVQFTVKAVQYCYCTFISSYSLLHSQYNSPYKQCSTVSVPLFLSIYAYTLRKIHCTNSILLLLNRYFVSLTVTVCTIHSTNSTVLLLYSYFFSFTLTLSVQFTLQTVQVCYRTAVSSHSLLHCQYNSLYKQYSTVTVPLFPLTHCFTVSTIYKYK